MMHIPPRLAEALLGRLLPSGLVGESIIGDAREEYARRVDSGSRGRAEVWYWIHALRLGIEYATPAAARAWMEIGMGIGFEFKRAIRTVLRRPGSAAVAVIVLGLGIGLSTFMFSVVFGLVHRGMGVPGEDRMRVIEVVAPSEGLARATLPAGLAGPLLGGLQTARTVAAHQETSANLVWANGRARLSTTYITGNGMAMLGTLPAIGRLLSPSDDDPGGDMALVLGHRAWERDFGSDPDVIGTRMWANGKAATVVGVMPEGFRFPQNTDVWVPLRGAPRDSNAMPAGRLTVIAQLEPGITIEKFEAELEAVARGMVSEDPALPDDLTFRSQTLVDRNTGAWIFSFFTQTSVVIAIVLFLACANVANLLMARASTRAGEVGVRVALGGSRLRVVIPFLLEALVLSLAGAAFGVALASSGLRLFNVWAVSEQIGFPYFFRFTVDAPALVFTIVLAVATALFTGIGPAVKASAVAPQTVLQAGGRGGSTLRLGRLIRVLVIAEVALSSAVLIGTGVTVKSLWELARVDLGFDPARVLTARAALMSPYYPDEESRRRFGRSLLDQLRRTPELEAVALADNLPGTGAFDTRLEVEGATYILPQDRPSGSIVKVSPGFFEVLGVVPIQGRTFRDDDDAGAPLVALVGESLARTAFPNGGALGARIRMDGDTIYRTIVGIVPDLTPQGLDPGTEPGGLYLSLAQNMPTFVSILARPRSGTPETAIRTLWKGAEAVDPELPLYLVAPLSARIDEGLWLYKTVGALFLFFGGAALLMAGVGLYGVLAFSIARRRWELGVRMALGARAAQIVSLVARQAAGQIGAGLVLGLGLGWLTANTLTYLSFRTEPRDPWIFLGVATVVMVVGVGATWMPARRALHASPTGIMRDE